MCNLTTVGNMPLSENVLRECKQSPCPPFPLSFELRAATFGAAPGTGIICCVKEAGSCNPPHFPPSPQHHSPQTRSPPSIRMVAYSPNPLSFSGLTFLLILGSIPSFPIPLQLSNDSPPGKAGEDVLDPWSSPLTFFSSLNPKFLKELSPFAAVSSCLFTVICYFIHSFFGQI